MRTNSPDRDGISLRSARGAAGRAAETAGGALTAAQRRAIGRMASGESATAAASAVGVHRQTVHRWLRDDPAFRAAFHAWQAAADAHAKARLLALADAAVTTVATAVVAGDVRTALAVLKGQGMLTPPTPGSTDPDQVARRQLNDAARAEAALVDAEATWPAEIYVPAKVRAHRAARRPPPPVPPAVVPADPPDAGLTLADLDPNIADLRLFDAGVADGLLDVAVFDPTPRRSDVGRQP